MSSIRIVTDSTAALPDDWLKDHKVAVVPLLVNIESEVYKESVEITNREFYARLRRSKSCPPRHSRHQATSLRLTSASWKKAPRPSSPFTFQAVSAEL